MSFKASNPIFKWAGGKSKLVPIFDKYFPSQNRKRLVEPFAGSLSVSLGLEFEHYLVNDFNEDLITFYRCLQKDTHTFIEQCRDLFQPENNTHERFLELRGEFNGCKQGSHKAALFLYLNRHSFNRLVRYGPEGFNAAYGKYKSVYFPEQEMQDFLTKASRFKFRCGSYLGLEADIKEGDLVYCDPPYIPLNKDLSFNGYSKKVFGVRDQHNVVEFCKRCSAKGATVFLSNHDTGFIRSLCRSHTIHELDVKRSLSGDGTKRGKVGEVLVRFKA